MAMRHTHAAMNHTARRSLIGVLSRGSARANVTAGARSFSAAPMVVTEHTDGALAAGTLHALKAASQLDSQVRLRRRAPPPPPARRPRVPEAALSRGRPGRSLNRFPAVPRRLLPWSRVTRRSALLSPSSSRR